MDETRAFPLRALSIGEIFDRAITIYVRNFVVFTLIVLTILAPVSVLQYFVLRDQSQGLAQVIDQIQHPPKHPSPMLSGEALVATMLLGLFVLLLAPFVNNAVAVGVAGIYRGKAPEYAPSFAAVFRRWAPLLGTAILTLVIIAGVFVSVLFGLILFGATVLLIVRAQLAFAIIVLILTFLAYLALVVFFVMLVIAYAFACYATSLENAGPLAAVRGAFRRIFNRREFRKALLMGLAYLALEIGVLVLSSTVSIVLYTIVRNYALQLVVNALFSSVLTAFLTILVAVYYYDVRTRAEALDLEVDLERLTATA